MWNRRYTMAVCLLIAGIGALSIAAPTKSIIGARNTIGEGAFDTFDPNGHNVLYVTIPSDNFTFTLSNLANYSGGTIDWGDGEETTVTSASPSHGYVKAGRYRIVMPDSLTAFGCQNSDSRVCVTALWAGPSYVSVANGPLRYLTNCKVMHFAAPKVTFTAYSLYSCGEVRDIYANKIGALGVAWMPHSASKPITLHADISEITTLNNMQYLTVEGMTKLKLEHAVSLGSQGGFSGAPWEEIMLSNVTLPEQKIYISFRDMPNLRRLVIPAIDWLNDSLFRNVPKLEYLEIGEITTFIGNYQYCFGTPATGREAPLVDGIRLTIKCGNTMSDLMGRTHFPFCYGGNFNTTKWICSDGYITYENGAWTPHYTTEE